MREKNSKILNKITEENLPQTKETNKMRTKH